MHTSPSRRISRATRTSASLLRQHEGIMKFKGSEQYVATDDLMLAVNAAITLQRPLLIKGEPGTGKTMLAEEVSRALGLPLLQWHIRARPRPSRACTSTSP